MEFNKETEQIALIRYKAWPGKHTDQQLLYT